MNCPKCNEPILPAPAQMAPDGMQSMYCTSDKCRHLVLVCASQELLDRMVVSIGEQVGVTAVLKQQEVS